MADTRDKFLLTVLAAGIATVIILRTQRRKRRTRVVGIIPARYESTRFPGKPLTPILGVPMIIRTYHQALKATALHAVVVATDDERIADVCRAAGAEVVMTSRDCPNGTERCSEAVAKLAARYDIVVNIQGDEPLLEPEIIDEVVAALQAAPDAVYRCFTAVYPGHDALQPVCNSCQCTACTPLAHDQVVMRQRVKCVMDANGYAIYFSRSPIPGNKVKHHHASPACAVHIQDGEVRAFPEPFARQPYLLHLGLQCYDRQFLQEYCRMAPTPLMAMEDLEQLKVIENGYRIKVVIVDHCAHGVDEPEDVASIEARMRELHLE